MSGAAGGRIGNALSWRLWPLPAGYEVEGPSLQELRPVYLKWYLLALLIIFAGWPVFGLGWWWVLREVAIWNAQRFEPALFVLHDASRVAAIPGMLLGLLSIIGCEEGLLRLLLGERHPEFARFVNLAQKIDNQKAAKPVIGVTLLLCLLVFFAMLNWRAVFTQGEIFL